MLTKELQDLAWNCLPLEVKKEVKRQYQIAVDSKAYAAEYTLGYLFGIHNLTSDAEGEEMLTCDRDVVRMLYDRTDSVKVRQTLESLFGSKCLPEGEPKPAEPKFKRGGIVIYKRTGKKKVVLGMDKYGRYMVALPNMQSPMYADESDLEPYTEPEYEHQHDDTAQKSADVNSNRNLPQETADCDNLSNNVLTDTQNAEIGNFVVKNEMVDHIIKDGFSKERRLNIAAQMLQALVCAPIISGVDPNPPAEQLAQTAFRLADALIAEAEKGGRDGEG